MTFLPKGNYYPVNVAASLRDSDNDLTVVVDRSVGAASLASGQLELMIHRRIHFDDLRGVTEFLDETEGPVMHWPILAKHTGAGLTIVSKHLLQLSTPKLAAPRWRSHITTTQHTDILKIQRFAKINL